MQCCSELSVLPPRDDLELTSSAHTLVPILDNLVRIRSVLLNSSRHFIPVSHSFVMSTISQNIAGPRPSAHLHTASALRDLDKLRPDVVGLSKAAILPSLGVHGGLSIIAYGIARATNRVELKDYLWPTGMVINAWWTGIGRHMFGNPPVSFGEAWSRLSYNQIALLGAATAWGARLTYRIVSRSLRRGKDDPRYDDVKTSSGFWNTAPFTVFLPEAVFQALITLPLTLPLSTDHISGMYGASPAWAGCFRWAAAGLFTAGLTMETLADNQMETHKQQAEEQGESKLLRSGVWSIVRHPNYLGDALCHFAFPLWNLGSGLFSPWQLLGPGANYVFLRGIGGDK